MEICIRWGFKESVHLSLSILPIQQSIDKYFEPQSLFSRHQQGSRMVSAGISIALCNKRSCSFTWKWCLIFMRMTALYNYRTTTWPLSDSIKSISQPEQKKKNNKKPTLKLLFWKVWLLEVAMCRDRASATVAPACNAHGSRPAPASVEAMERLLPALMSSGPAWMHLNCHWSGWNSSFLVYVWGRKGQKFHRLQSCSDPLHQRWVWLLGFKAIFCFKAQPGMRENIQWQQGWGSGCSHYNRRPKSMGGFYRRKKQASRHRLVPWGVSERTKWITTSPYPTFLFSFALPGWHLSGRHHIPLILQPSRRSEVSNWDETKSQHKICSQQLF